MSQNDFLLQTIADLTGCKVVRAGNLQTTALGVAFFAGLSSSKPMREKAWLLHMYEKGI